MVIVTPVPIRLAIFILQLLVVGMRAGTDDGLIHVTRDGGKTWKNVTPPGMTPWSKVAQLDASHFDDDTVYAAVNRLRLDDLKAHIYRDPARGRAWQRTHRGPADAAVN